jgi:hypothetical protein
MIMMAIQWGSQNWRVISDTIFALLSLVRSRLWDVPALIIDSWLSVLDSIDSAEGSVLKVENLGGWVMLVPHR